MRVFSKFSFVIGNLSFADVLDRIDSFLCANDLHYQAMGYYICDMDMPKKSRIASAQYDRLIPRRKSATVSDMHDLVSEYPQLGSIQNRSGGNAYQNIVLTNLDDWGKCLHTDCGESILREIARKYPIPYYVSFLLLSYLNVDFFGKSREPVEESTQSAAYETMQRKGSHITLGKYGKDSIKLNMTVEITDGQTVLDASPYAKSLSEILGKKFSEETVLILSADEEAKYRALNENAAEIVNEVKSAVCEMCQLYHMPEREGSVNIQTSDFSVPKSLKRIGKKFGFTKYRYDSYNVFFLSKQTPEGHLMTLVVDAPPRFNELRFSVHLTGLGFQHKFPMGEFYVQSQEIADDLIHTSFEIIEKLSQNQLGTLSRHYPDTPAWFTPNEWMLTPISAQADS